MGQERIKQRVQNNLLDGFRTIQVPAVHVQFTIKTYTEAGWKVYKAGFIGDDGCDTLVFTE